MKNPHLSYLSFCLLFLSLSACAGKTTEITVVPGNGERVVAIRASNFSYTPEIIHAHQGDRLLLQVTNATGTAHNLTVKYPGGKIARSVDLAAGKTVDISLELTEEGAWTFYCDIPFHETLGMSGRIEAPAPP